MNYEKDKIAKDLGILPNKYSEGELNYSISRRSDTCVIYFDGEHYLLYKIALEDTAEVLGKLIAISDNLGMILRPYNERSFFGSNISDKNKSNELCSLDDPENCLSCGS